MTREFALTEAKRRANVLGKVYDVFQHRETGDCVVLVNGRKMHLDWKLVGPSIKPDTNLVQSDIPPAIRQ